MKMIKEQTQKHPTGENQREAAMQSKGEVPTIILLKRWSAMLLALCLSAGTLHATTNLALNAPVVNYSSQLGAQWAASKVTDGYRVDIPVPGYVEEFSAYGSFWLNNSTGNEFFIIDLGASYHIGKLRIANTSNGEVNDRRGLTFEVLAANALDGSNLLVSPTTIVGTSSLTVPNGSGYNVLDVFNSSELDLGSYRYVEYHQLTGGGYGGGLNEFQVLALPEPSSVLLLGLGGVVLWKRGRRSRD